MTPTIDQLLSMGRARLAPIAGDRSLFEARLLLSQVLRLSSVDILAQGSKSVNSNDAQRFKELVERRGQSEPMAYLLGEKDFLDFKFQVGPGVLIPRPETETLVLEVAKWIEARSRSSGHKQQFRVLDLGTGSGCIILSLKKILGDRIEAHAIDESAAALEFARKNAEQLGAHDVQFYKLSWTNREEILKLGRFDIIVSNPPYIPESHWQSLQKDIRDFEPTTALIAENNGLKDFEEILDSVWPTLNEGGLLAFETYDELQREALLKILPKDSRAYSHEAHLFIEKRFE